MKIRVLLYESQIDRLDLTMFEGVQSELDISRVTTEQEFLEAVDTYLIDLVISGSNVAWPAIEACAHLQRRQASVPFLLLLEKDDPDLRRQALCAGVWQTFPRVEVDTIKAVVGRVLVLAGERRDRVALQQALARTEEVLHRNQKSIAMGIMLGSIAHEINNPLESMANLLYLARRSQGNPEAAAKVIEMAEAELDHVSGITKQMLNFHRETKTPQEVRVPEILNGVLALFAAKLREKQTTVVCQYKSAGWMLAHPGELRQIFANLISNALDAIDGSGRLILRVKEHRGHTPRLCVSVADNGKGITRAERKNIGDLFFTTKSEAGTGLGMWVVRRTLKKYNGGLSIYSSKRPGKSGTVFRLCFQQPHALFSKQAAGDTQRSVSMPDTKPDQPSSNWPESRFA